MDEITSYSWKMEGDKGLSPGGVPMLKSREGEEPGKYWEGPPVS